jgi:galactose mutarotase-like enzyme
MRSILIRNEDGSMEAEVDGRDALSRDEGEVSASFCRSGGIPVLFPFAGRSGDDSYRITWDVLALAARVENGSRRPMPHALGWHPYFRASDRTRLDRDWDDVFREPSIREFSFENPADGCALRCAMDNASRSIVVYTGSAGSVCIEPWCGVPDSINNGRQIQWIPPGQSMEYKVQSHLKAI